MVSFCWQTTWPWAFTYDHPQTWAPWAAPTKRWDRSRARWARWAHPRKLRISSAALQFREIQASELANARELGLGFECLELAENTNKDGGYKQVWGVITITNFGFWLQWRGYRAFFNHYETSINLYEPMITPLWKILYPKQHLTASWFKMIMATWWYWWTWTIRAYVGTRISCSIRNLNLSNPFHPIFEPYEMYCGTDEFLTAESVECRCWLVCVVTCCVVVIMGFPWRNSNWCSALSMTTVDDGL